MRCLLARDVGVTLITPPAAASRPVDPQADAVFRHPQLSVKPVPYTTFPFANRRGTTIVDRSTAYPLFGMRAGRAAARLVLGRGSGCRSWVWGRASLDTRSRTLASRRAPLVFNPQGLEEFGATDPARAPLKRLGYWPLRVAVRRCARAADRVIATDRVAGHSGRCTSSRAARYRARDARMRSSWTTAIVLVQRRARSSCDSALG